MGALADELLAGVEIEDLGIEAARRFEDIEDPGGRGVLSTLLELPIGGALGLIDLLDRPGRAARHLVLGGDFGAAASDILTPFLPQYLERKLGLDPSEPFFTSDWLEQQGVPAGYQLPILGSTRSIGGFFADILLDPLTYLAGTGVFTKVNPLVTKTGRRGVLALDRLAVKGGVAGGLTEAGLAVGGLFSDFTRLRGLARDVAPEEGIARIGKVLDITRQARSQRRGLLQVGSAEHHELTKILSEVDAQYHTPFLQTISEPDLPQALREAGLLSDEVGLREIEALQTTQAIGLRQAGREAEQLPLFAQQIQREGGVQAAQRGAAAVERALDRLSSLPKEAQNAVLQWFDGSPKVRAKFGFNLGSRQRESVKYQLGVIQREQVLDFVERNQLARQFKLSLDPTKYTPDTLTDEMVARLGAQMGIKTSNMTGKQVRDMLARAKSGSETKARRLALSLEKADDLWKVIRDEPGERLALETYNYANVVSATGFLDNLLDDGRFFTPVEFRQQATLPGKVKGVLPVKPGPVEWVAREAPEGMVEIPAGEFPAFFRRKVTSLAPDGTKAGVWVPEALARDIRGVFRRVSADPDGNAIRQGVQAITRMYQGWTLALFPSTWLTNLMGNMWNNYLAGHGGINHLVEAGDRILNPAVRKANKPIQIGKQTLTHQKFMEEVFEDQILGGYIATELYDQLTKDMIGTTKPGVLKKWTDPALNPVTRGGFAIMQGGDDIPRLAHYLSARRGGATRDEAADSVRRWLYTGETLTDFERANVRPVAPFIGWAKFNIPRSFWSFFEAPQRIAPWGRLKIRLDEQLRGDIPDEMLPEWLQSQMTIPVGRDAEGRLSIWALSRWIPTAQLQELSTPKRTLEFIMNQVTPLLKEPVQQSINYDFFFRDIIQRYPGEIEEFWGLPLAKRSTHLIRQARLFAEVDRVFFPKTGAQNLQHRLLEDLTTEERAMRVLVGRKYTIRLTEAKRRVLRRYQREIGQLRSGLKRARTTTDQASITQIEREIAFIKEKRAAMAGIDPRRNPRFLAEDAA